jgi:hypothetical protein
MPRPNIRLRADAGQAAVETVAVLPLLVVLAAGLWQAALAGHAHWSATGAARAAARAEAVGGDGERAARLRLPATLERRMRLTDREGGDVALRVAIPALPGLPSLGHVTAHAHFEEQE